MSEEALLEKGLHMLSSPDRLKSLEIKHDDKILTLNMTMLFGYPFKLTLNLSKGSNNMVCICYIPTYFWFYGC